MSYGLLTEVETILDHFGSTAAILILLYQITIMGCSGGKLVCNCPLAI